MTTAPAQPVLNSSGSKPRNECGQIPPFRRVHLIRRWARATFRRERSKADRAWSRSLAGARNVAVLDALRNRHWGKRCFVLGNGPSLNSADLSVLRDEYIIASNRIYLHPACRDWTRWYYCAVNPNVIEQFSTEIAALPAMRFLAWEHRHLMPGAENTVWLRSRNEPRFSFDPADAIWQGATVTYVALQMAFHLGFTDVVLFGVDHHYDRAGQPNKLVTSGEPDPDHFAENYFGEGVRWQLPDLSQSELAYRFAKLAFEQEGRRVRDATINGKLDVFPKVRLADLF